MAKRNKSYLHDFRQSSDGSYAYAGETWQADRIVWRRLLVKLWALQAVMLFSAILPGFATTAGLVNTFYVILPYVFWVISDIYLTYLLGNMTFGGNPMRDYIYERSVVRYGFCTALPLVCAVLTAFALAVFLLRGGTGEGAAVCLVCCIIQTAVSVIGRRCKPSEIWVKTAEESGK